MQKDSFAQIVHEYQKLIFAVCVKLTGDYFAAEDLTQETFLSAYQHQNQFDGQIIKAWLCRIASNKAIDYNREAARRMQPTDEKDFPVQTATKEGPEDLYLEREVRDRLKERCADLKDPYNRIAIRYFCEEKKTEEIALEMKTNIKTIQTQIYRARDMLRRVYREEEQIE